MTDEAKVVTFNKTYEAVISFIPRQRVLLRISATSEEMAKKAIEEMTTDDVADLVVESLEEVDENDPVPEDYDEASKQELEPADKKQVH